MMIVDERLAVHRAIARVRVVEDVNFALEDATRICDYGNLAYACLRCNSFKQAVRMLDPTQEGMGRHLRVEPDGSVTGLTEDGQFLIELLQLNVSSVISERLRILRILKLRQRYPED